MAYTVNDMHWPWQYRPHENDDWGRVVGSDGLTICYAHVGRFSTEEQQAHREKGTDPAEPVAKLIAAATDLLGAAKEALSVLRTASRQLSEDHRLVLGGRGWGWRTIAKLEGLIAKAEGRS